MSTHSPSTLDTRFPQLIDATRFSYTDNLTHLAADAPVIPARLRHDIRSMSPVRFQACFRSVIETMREHTAGEESPPAEIPPEQVRSAAQTRFFIIGTRLDTHAIPDSRRNRTEIADDQPVLLDADVAFISETDGNDELFIEQVADDLDDYDYFLLGVTHGTTLPGIGDVAELSVEGLRPYFDKTLETREHLLATDDQCYDVYRTLIGAALQHHCSESVLPEAQQPE